MSLVRRQAVILKSYSFVTMHLVPHSFSACVTLNPEHRSLLCHANEKNIPYSVSEKQQQRLHKDRAFSYHETIS